MSTVKTAREEELEIEVERLKAWLYKIQIQSFSGCQAGDIESMAINAIKHSSCVTQPDWGYTEEWAKLGLWPT